MYKFIVLLQCFSLISLSAPIQQKSPALYSEIYFREEVNDDTVNVFLNSLKEAKSDTVLIHIDTPGGSVGAGFIMSRAMEESGKRTICVVDGMAASMGLFILQSCDVRVMTDRSLLMAHGASTVVRGNAQELRQDLKLLEQMNTALAAHIVHRAKISLDEYLKKTGEGDWWMSFQEAIEMGFVDVYVQSVSDVRAVLNQN